MVGRGSQLRRGIFYCQWLCRLCLPDSSLRMELGRCLCEENRAALQTFDERLKYTQYNKISPFKSSEAHRPTCTCTSPSGLSSVALSKYECRTSLSQKM